MSHCAVLGSHSGLQSLPFKTGKPTPRLLLQTRCHLVSRRSCSAVMTTVSVLPFSYFPPLRSKRTITPPGHFQSMPLHCLVLSVRCRCCQEQHSNQTNVSAHCSSSFRAIAQRISRWRDVPIYCTELFAWLVSNPRCNRERLAIACSTARALPTARRPVCVEESSVRSRLYCNCGDDARDHPNPEALPLLSLLPGASPRCWLGVAFSSIVTRVESYFVTRNAGT